MKAFLLSVALILTAIGVHAQSANVKTVMDNYARFGQNDIAGILATFSENSVWIHAGNPEILAFAGTHNGQAGIGQFFEKVGQTIQVTVFQPANFRENGNVVSNDTHIEGTVIATGKAYSSDLVMTWTFGPDGKAVRWEATGDMTSLEAAASSK